MVATPATFVGLGKSFSFHSGTDHSTQWPEAVFNATDAKGAAYPLVISLPAFNLISAGHPATLLRAEAHGLTHPEVTKALAQVNGISSMAELNALDATRTVGRKVSATREVQYLI